MVDNVFEQVLQVLIQDDVNNNENKTLPMDHFIIDLRVYEMTEKLD